MTWFFSRGDERLTWEVRRSGTLYELCVQRADGTASIQSVETPRELLDHIHQIPRALLTDGWRPVHAAQF